ncbi:hypothetical protein BpHYR1_020563 [Brachionus plicatilis]|uniref:Secreted protein n=1 Tax=Brachionus plicatilis TaxID=10195 RepID=A0A3M7S8I2_BRAPC|nr:hypothetical protein BpHYR1_020563 [Brachionus plicatilis]
MDPFLPIRNLCWSLDTLILWSLSACSSATMTLLASATFSSGPEMTTCSDWSLEPHISTFTPNLPAISSHFLLASKPNDLGSLCFRSP